MQHPRSLFQLPLYVSFAAFCAAACDSTSTSPPAAAPVTLTAPIVNGEVEQGYPAVGALVMSAPNLGYAGSFCSGTLIHREWVLTAGHCLEGEGGFGEYVKPANVYFFIGTYAEGQGNSAPPGARLVPALSFHVHPDYGNGPVNDIAMMRLAQPVDDVVPIAAYDGPFGNAFIGNLITYVGFGVTDGLEQDGGGVKRRAQMPISSVETSKYNSTFDTQGVCFGDSGGPGLRQFDGEWRVVGVNSAVAGAEGTDPCKGYAVHTRVDAYRDWIAALIDNPPEITGCLLDPSFCACDDACNPDGSCNNDLCPVPGSCRSLVQCIDTCDDDAACAGGCEVLADPAAKSDFDVMNGCLANECEGKWGKGYFQCAYTTCGSTLLQCLEPNGGVGDVCSEVYQCTLGCMGTPGCTFGCQQGATVRARVELQELLVCYEQKCPNLDPGDPGFQECAVDQCAGQIDACFDGDEPVLCDLLEQDCPAGQACVLAKDGSTVCAKTQGRDSGDSCDPKGVTGVQCGAGSLCVQGTDGIAACAEVCSLDEGCGDRRCDAVPQVAIDGVGVCGCEDADGDGSCASDDCDDGDASAAPGQGEVCGDGVDNDCSGDIDEDCEPAAEPDAGGEGDAPTDEGGLSGEGEIRDGGSGGCQHADPASFWGVFGLAAALLWRSRRRVSSTR